MARFNRMAVVVGVVLANLALSPASWAGSSLDATYFTVQGDPTFGSQCCGTYGDMVTNTLGPDGLPVLNTAASDIPSSFLTALEADTNSSGELTWWTPGTYVTPSGTGTITLPFSSTSMYPPNGTSGNDANGFLSAVFTGKFTLPTTSTVSFSLGADDDAFFYVDGSLVNSIGGVHPDTPAPVTTSILGAGTHTILLFYDDRYPTAAALDFNLTSQGITITPPVPEPTTFVLLAAGLGFIGFMKRRRAGDGSVA